jgi:hypothetical protein
MNVGFRTFYYSDSESEQSARTLILVEHQSPQAILPSACAPPYSEKPEEVLCSFSEKVLFSTMYPY